MSGTSPYCANLQVHAPQPCLSGVEVIKDRPIIPLSYTVPSAQLAQILTQHND